ncbi:MAG TPA: hypothetical protein VGT03_14505 [Candidatus Acidoferrales bacterium]|nr:hypothetical protein [Candidatus Acidoferrales bacterium]
MKFRSGIYDYFFMVYSGLPAAYARANQMKGRAGSLPAFALLLWPYRGGEYRNCRQKEAKTRKAHGHSGFSSVHFEPPRSKCDTNKQLSGLQFILLPIASAMADPAKKTKTLRPAIGFAVSSPV